MSLPSAPQHGTVCHGQAGRIAALFNPLRRRTWAFIDRRFACRKYDAARVVACGATPPDETDLERLTARLVGVCGRGR